MLEEATWLLPAHAIFGAVAGLLLLLSVILAIYGYWIPAAGIGAVALGLAWLARSAWRHRKEVPA